MGSFAAHIAAVHAPRLSLVASRDCDAIVRTSTPHPSLSALLSTALFAHRPTAPPVLVAEQHPRPPLWLHATRALDDALRTPSALGSPASLADAFADALEKVTAVAEHTHFATPVLHLAAAWVGEDSAALPKAPADTAVDDPPMHVLLVVREDSRQDLAQLDLARPAMAAAHGEHRVHLLRLPTADAAATSPANLSEDSKKPSTDTNTDANATSGDHASDFIAAFARKLDSLIRITLNDSADVAVIAADKARRAARPSFRSWFSSATTASPALRAPSPPPGTSSSRRTSFGSAARPPLFDESSVEHLTRRAADLLFVAGRYAEAADLYRMLAADTRALTGVAIVHEAAALEAAALTLACLPGSPTSVASALDRALAAYVRAARPELAARLTLRAARFCNAAGFPDSAAAFITRALGLLAPATPAASSGSAFVDVALAALSAAAVSAASAAGKRRRASLYAFLGMTRFAAHRALPAAACLAQEVDPAALVRTTVRHEVNLVLGAAAAADGRASVALPYFIAVLAASSERTDVELQSAAARGFMSAVAAGATAGDASRRRWDAGLSFPALLSEDATVVTPDSASAQPVWRELEDDILEDHAFFRSLRTAPDDRSFPKRERRVEAVVTELRRRRDRHEGIDPGGSLEMKIRRMREMSVARRRRLREASLLERGAVVGETVKLKVSFRNPLQFPVFIADVSPVVTLDGKLLTARDMKMKAVGNGPAELNNSQTEIIEVKQNGQTLPAGEAVHTNDNLQPVQLHPIEDVTLLPSSTHMVELTVEVCRAGTLQFIGVMWDFTIGMGGNVPKASTSVPGFAVLQKKGRRLNETRKQRASDVPLYEDDKSLTVNVVPAAPKLKSKLLCKVNDCYTEKVNDVILRAGEKREACIVIENAGNVQVSNLVIRLGTPQTLFADITPSTIVHDSTRISCALGAEENLVDQREVMVAAETAVNLAPGETMRFPVWLRAAVPGSTFAVNSAAKMRRLSTSRMEYFNEDDDGIVTSTGRILLAYGEDKVRVSRMEWKFRVRPSILVSPRFMRGTEPGDLVGMEKKLCGVLLGIEVEHAGRNTSESLKFEVTDVSVTSRNGWRPIFLPAPEVPDDECSDELVPSPSSLRINETATVFILIVREKDVKGDGKEDCESRMGPWRTYKGRLGGNGDVVENANGEENRKTGSGGDVVTKQIWDDDVDCEEEACTHFVVVSNHSSIYSMGSNSERELVCVAIGWKTPEQTYGQVHIPAIDPVRWMKKTETPMPVLTGPVQVGIDKEARHGTEETEEMRVIMDDEEDEEADCVAELEKLGDEAVSVSIEHEHRVQHDFLSETQGDSGRNGAVHPAQVGVEVRVRNVSRMVLDVVFSAREVGGVGDGDRGRYWAGDVSMTLRSLPPGAERMLQLTAVLTCPGRYNLARFNVVFQLAGSGASKLRRVVGVQPSFVTVHNVPRGEHKSEGSSPVGVGEDCRN